MKKNEFKNIPIYSVNNDIVYADKFPLPRIAFGPFTESLKFLHKLQFNRELNIEHYGKPFENTFNYASFYFYYLIYLK